MSPRWFRILSVVSLLWTVLVILWGAYVRATGSGAGCGDHWPLCDGEVVPRAPDTAKLIEFTHRATSGLAGLLALGVFVGAWKAHGKGHRTRRAAFGQLFFMITESLIGAGLVLFEYVANDLSEARALWVAAHLVNTFVLVAAQTLTIWYAYGGAKIRFQGKAGALAATALGLTTLVGLSGAVAALGATLFPAESLSEGLAADLSPTAHLFVRLRIFHLPIAVVSALVSVAIAAVLSLLRPTPLTKRLAISVGALFLTQLCVGAVNLVLHAPVWLQIVHLLFADAVWIALILLCCAALSVREEATETGLQPAPA